MEFKPLAVLTAALAFTASFGIQEAYAGSNESAVGPEVVLHDSLLPAEENPDGDVTIVEYFDYRCLPCKQVSYFLEEIAREDKHVRLVFKDWPVFGGISVYMARVALAATFQNKLLEAHKSLISLRGAQTKATVLASLKKAGINTSRLERDLLIHETEIDRILTSNQRQATILEFRGTPGLIVGNIRVPGVFNTKDFKKFIAEARATTGTD